ncbi:MAG: sugar ABC transporter ATP-binding protein [Geminicoccaceae bacterium]
MPASSSCRTEGASLQPQPPPWARLVSRGARSSMAESGEWPIAAGLCPARGPWQGASASAVAPCARAWLSSPRGGRMAMAGGDDGPAVWLLARGVGKSFSGVRVLDGIDLALRAGEVHALVGENGAGKSTLVKILSGVHAEYDGQILIDGTPVRFAGVRDAERHGVAIIHQELNLVPELDVAGNIFLGREPRIAGLLLDRRAMLRAARRLLGQLGLDLDPERKVGRLRVGEQQVVEIAKALSLDARILIMDEPTSALSTAEAERLEGIVRQLARDGVAIVYITHRLEEVFALARQVTVLRDGRKVLTAPAAELSRGAIIKAMVGRELSELGTSGGAGQGRPALEVRELTMVAARPGAPPRRVVDRVSFTVRRGEVLGIGGLLGSGRTEILETIFGVADGERSGSVLLDGRPVTIDGPEQAKAQGLAFVTEDRKATGLVLDFPIRANAALPSLGRLARFGFTRRGRETALAREAIARLGIRCTGPEQAVAGLSGGNQQKVVLGKWLATAPRVLLLDEPTRGIDVGAKQEVYALIDRLRAAGVAIVMVSSELPELLLLADRVLVMCEGRQTGILDRDAASQERVMELAAPKSLDGRAA